jgi:hypothetical protein
MRSIWPVLFLAIPLAAGPAMVLARIDRAGLPPYEGEQGRLYVLEGASCGALRQGSQVLLRRPGTGLQVGRLVILRAAGDSAVGELAAPGEDFPQKGDEAILAVETRPAKASPPASRPIAEAPKPDLRPAPKPASRPARQVARLEPAHKQRPPAPRAARPPRLAPAHQIAVPDPSHDLAEWVD